MREFFGRVIHELYAEIINCMKKKKYLTLVLNITAIIIISVCISGCYNKKEQRNQISLLVGYEEDCLLQIDSSTLRKESKDGWYQCIVELDAQFYDLDSISLNFSENVWHEIVMANNDEILKIEKAKKGTITIPIPEQTEYIMFSIKEDEASSLYPKGILSQDALKEKKGTSFSGKKVAVLGDSLSAVSNYVSSNYWSLYPAEGVSVKDMWWYLAAEELDMEICEINACGGSGVTQFSWANQQGMVPMEGRGKSLNKWGENPEIIWVLLGGNDIIGGAGIDEILTGYTKLLNEIKEGYPQADIYLMTYYPLNAEYKEGTEYLNKMIEQLGETNGVQVINLENCGITWDNTQEYRLDELHPNKEGMLMIAEEVIREMQKSS